MVPPDRFNLAASALSTYAFVAASWALIGSDTDWIVVELAFNVPVIVPDADRSPATAASCTHSFFQYLVLVPRSYPVVPSKPLTEGIMSPCTCS